VKTDNAHAAEKTRQKRYCFMVHIVSCVPNLSGGK
jgi:hypothetical protein